MLGNTHSQESNIDWTFSLLSTHTHTHTLASYLIYSCTINEHISESKDCFHCFNYRTYLRISSCQFTFPTHLNHGITVFQIINQVLLKLCKRL